MADKEKREKAKQFWRVVFGCVVTDYYKVLGINRTATPREIKSAYHAMALEWHPDKYKGEDLEMAERKFHEIVVAYETLSDPEKRAKHDRGEDQQRVQFEMNGGSFKVFATGGAAPAFQIPVR
eukprot:c11180_g1_i2.p1 GENE.c11180_g1_i2~~c11180_g1_i2.p1  ORF type:complete len:123 (+),score=20.79 c11180_g1_i2:196-564(+)